MKDYLSFKENLFSLISFNTVNDKSTFVNGELAPFGEENYKALNFILSLAKDFGFETINYDNYAGEITFGNGEEIGIIGHLDIVPTGIGWETDPFTLTEKDGYLYGRGVVDDKAPTLMCLYALKELKESLILPNKKFRLFLGCNEETGWKDIEYLSIKTTMPEYGFSPDGDFPVSYAEKGITQGVFYLPTLKNFYDFKGGKMENAVCDYATIKATKKGINKTLLKKFNLTLLDDNIIESRGKASHGSMPHLGQNALKPIFEYLLEMGEDVKNFVDYLFCDKGNISKMQNQQGVLTMAPAMVKEVDNKTAVVCDFRIPAPLNHNDLVKVLDTFNIEYKGIEKHPTMMVDKNGKFVQTLIKSYNQITKQNCEPISMGGSTFARAFKYGCAFGPDFNKYDTHIHDANERIKEEDLLMAYEIYRKTIFDLAKN